MNYDKHNWLPKSHQEFLSMAKNGRVALNIDVVNRDKLYRLVHWTPWNLFTSYKKKLLRSISKDETLFWKVHKEICVDLVRRHPNSK